MFVSFRVFKKMLVSLKDDRSPESLSFPYHIHCYVREQRTVTEHSKSRRTPPLLVTHVNEL